MTAKAKTMQRRMMGIHQMAGLPDLPDLGVDLHSKFNDDPARV